MGGNAFGTYETPRLPPELYERLKRQYFKQLSTLFRHVITPIEAPGKIDHGDLDILVHEPFPNQLKCLTGTDLKCTTVSAEELRKLQIKAVQKLLNPLAIIQDSSTITLALPHPGSIDSCVQVDVSIQPTYSQWRWLFFTHSHGDFWPLIGSSLRQVGLVATDKGFFARDIVIEPHDRKRCLILLTDEPSEVIRFLGLDSRHWIAQGNQNMETIHRFSTKDELFHTITSMRFFDRNCYQNHDRTKGDKKKVAQRHLYREFIEEYLPANLPAQKEEEIVTFNAQQSQLREQIFNVALDYWNKRKEWRKIRSAWDWDYTLEWTRRKFEKKKFDLREANRYSDAWTEWCGYPVIEAAEPLKQKKKKK